MIHQNFRIRVNSSRLISLVAGAFFLTTAIPAYAEYKPRDRKAASGYTQGGGSRGCFSDGLPLTLLAPKTFRGKTASKRPMLAWYMSKSQNVRFRLFEFTSDTDIKEIGEFKEIPTRVGINKLKLPTDYPELAVGKSYLWQIAIDCGIGTILKRAEFTVINPNLSHEKNKLTTIPDVDDYAKNEQWYEALEQALKTANNGKLGQTGAKLVQELAESEMPPVKGSNPKMIEQRTEYLQQISRDNL